MARASGGGSAKRNPRLAYLVTEDWYFLSHRLPMAQAAKAAGYDVHVITNVGSHGDAIVELGFELHHVRWRRGGINPIDLAALIGVVRGCYRSIAPDLVHHVALEPTVIGSLAALGLPTICLNAVTGWGFALTSAKPRARVARAAIEWILPRLLARRRSFALVQNDDDRTALAGLGVRDDRIFLIAGSGVDTELLRPLPEPGGRITIGFVGRLLESKGLRTLVAAHDLLARRGCAVRLLIAGDTDAANPDAISRAEIATWEAKRGIELLGHVSDIRQVWTAAHIAVLPSRREGLPKSLLEAAACGRPLVATDVPGCRAVARAGVNALLTPADDAAALADAIETLAQDEALRRRFGAASRRLAEAEFASQSIGRATVALYDRLLGKS